MGEYAWLIAPVAVLGTTFMAVWGQIRGIWRQAASRVIVTARYQEEAAVAIEFFLNRRCKPSRWGPKTFGGVKWYVFKTRRTEVIPYETIDSQPRLFWFGRMPLFVSIDSKAATNTQEGAMNTFQPAIKIVSLRGFTTLEQILIQATRDLNENVNSFRDRRFAVLKRCGTMSDFSNSGSTGSRPRAVQDLYDIAARRLLMHDIADLGDQRQESPIGTFDGLIETQVIAALRRRWEWWVEDRAWYEERRLAWKDGWLLYGPPGTGKTSAVRSIARHYDVPIYTLDMPSARNSDLTEIYLDACSNTPAIVLLEDVDTIFKGREGRKTTDAKGRVTEGITFEAMLEALDGIDRNHGVVTVMTTNHYDALDAALIRPGRINVHLEVEPFGTAYQEKLIKFLLGENAHQLDFISAQETPAALTARCIELAIKIKNQTLEDMGHGEEEIQGQSQGTERTRATA